MVYWNKKISDKMIKEMRELRKQGLTGLEIADRYNINPTSVYLHTRGYEVKKINKRTEIKKLKGKISNEEIAKRLGTSVNYVNFVISREKCGEEVKKVEKPKKKIKKETERQQEVREICERVKREKEERQKQYKKDLAEEIERLKIRFKGIAR